MATYVKPRNLSPSSNAPRVTTTSIPASRVTPSRNLTPVYYTPPPASPVYTPSPSRNIVSTYIPYQQQYPSYSPQTYPQHQIYTPTPQQRVSVPTTLVSTVTTPKAVTPVIQGKNISYQKVSDLGTIGDHKTIQMPDGSYRDYVRTGTNTYQYTEIRAADKATVTAKSDSTGAVQVTRVAPSASTPASSSLPTRPLVLYEIPNQQSISTTDISKVGDVTQVSKPDGGYISYKRISPTQIQYQEYSKAGQITTPWTSIYEEPPTVAPAVKLTPAATSPPVTPKASEFIAAPLIGTKTQIASSSKADKPDFSVLRIMSSGGILPGAAPAGEGEGKEGAGDESAEESKEDEQSEKDEGLVPDWIENPITGAFGRAKDPFERLYNAVVEPEVEIPKREEGVIGGGVKDPVSPSTEIPTPSLSPTLSPVAPVASPSLGAAPPSPSAAQDDGIPRTEEQKQAATLEWLKTKQEYYGLTDKEVENLAKYFSPMLPAMTQNKVDLKTVAANAQLYEDLFNGKAEAFEQFDNAFLAILDTSGDFKGFESLPLPDQKYVLKKWNEKMIDDGVPAIVIASYNAGIYTKLTQNSKTEDVAEWMRKGGVLDAIENDPLWQDLSAAKEFLHSKNGMAAVGLTFQAVATIGAFMTAGPIGAAAVAGTTPFSATEAWQTWGDNPFTNKANLQLDANYAWDYSSQHDQLFNNAKSAVDDMGFKANSNDPAANVGLMSTAERAVDALGKSLKDNYVMLQATGTYDSEVQKYDILKERLGTGKSQFSETGEFDKKQYKPSYADFQNIPAGYHVEWNGETRASGDHKIRGGDGSTESVVIAINDETGERLPLGSVKVQPFGQDTTYDVGSAIEKALSYKKNGGLPAEEQHQTLVLNTDPSTKVEINGQVFQRRIENGIDVKKIDVSVPGYYQVKTTQADGTVEEKRVYVGAGQSLSITEPSREVVKEVRQTLVLNTDPTSTVYINGKPFKTRYDGQIFVNKIDVSVPGRYKVEVVDAQGNKSSREVYVGEGDTVAISDPAVVAPKEPYQSYPKSSGGGGGGGYSGGGGGGGYQQQPKPEEETLIIYGPTCKDAELWQDEVQVYPEIDEPYSISPGYHSIKAIREGFKPWLKTVYCASGDSITVSPAFEPVDGSGEPTEPVDSIFPKRVFINSDPSGGLVLVNGSSSGEWTPCYLDLPEGYYTFTIKKSGYDPYDILCYVGEVIAWNNQAVELATSRGWI